LKTPDAHAFADEMIRRAYDSYHPTTAQLGFGFKSIGRGIKKGAKGVGRGVVKVGKTGYAVGKFSVNLAALPLKYLLKAARAIGVTFCKAPPRLLEQAAIAANVDPKFLPLFCAAVRENKLGLGNVRRLLPPALKMAAKMAAAGAFPPIVPALAIIKHIPFVNQLVGPESDVNVDSADVVAVQRAMGALQIVALADHLGMLDGADVEALGLGSDDRTVLQGLVAEQVALAAAEDTTDRNAMILGGVTAATAGLGFYLSFR
jgi:hypothetical protein